MRILVVTSRPVSAAHLREALSGDSDPKDVEVMVVAPALQSSALRFWLSDADEAIAQARETERQTVERLTGEGDEVAVSETGEIDPQQPTQDALQSFPADHILVFTQP